MFIPLLVITGVSLLVLLVGMAWWLASSGETRRRSGAEVGAEIMRSFDDEGDSGFGVNLLDKSAFKGEAVAVEREVGISYAEVKRLLRAGHRAALPPLIAMVGLAGFLVFGALALWAGLDDKLIGALIAVPVLVTMARIGWDIYRA